MEGEGGKNPNLCHPRESNWQFPRGVPVQMNFIRVKRFCMLLKPCKGINFDHFSLLSWSRLVFIFLLCMYDLLNSLTPRRI